MALQDKKKSNKSSKHNIVNSFRYGFSGIWYMIKKEPHIRTAFIIIAIGSVLSYLLEISGIEWVICIIHSTLIISLEMINTAIETSINIAMPHVHPLAKIAKDVAAGSVVFACISAAISGIIIFLPKIMALF